MTKRREWQLLACMLVAVDSVALITAFAAAYLVRFRLGWFAVHDISPNERNYLGYGAAGLALWIIAFAMSGLYQPDRLLTGTREYARLVQGCLAAFAAAVVLSSMFGSVPFVSRGVLAAALPLSIVCAGLGRFGIRRVARRLRHRGMFIARAVIIGASDDGISIARQIDRPRSSGVDVAGFLDDFLPAGTLIAERWPVLGRPAALDTLDVDEAIVVPSALTWESHFELMQRIARGVGGPTVRLAPGFFDLFTTAMNITDRGNVPVVTAERSRITGIDATAKRLLETVVATLLLSVYAPWMVKWALDRRLRGRPVLRYRRFHGPRGATLTAATFAPNGQRQSAHARLMEKTPLLLAVLTGRLALVGPRLTEVTDTSEPDGRLALLAVRPGLTGPASVQLPNGPDDQALALELRYVRDYSVWRDLQLIWRRAGQLIRDLLQPGQARQRYSPRPLVSSEPTASRPSRVEAP